MELAAQPICMNAYFFCGRFVLHLQTGNVNRSAISSGAFAVFPLEIHWIQSWNTPPCLWNSKLRYPPTSSEFQSKKPPLSLGIPRCRPWYGMDIFWNHPLKNKVNFKILRWKVFCQKYICYEKSDQFLWNSGTSVDLCQTILINCSFIFFVGI